jgi:hypothetical protein
MKMNLTGAIEILKLHKHTTDKFKHSVGDQYVSDAIDTVIAELEKPTYTVEDMEAFFLWASDNGWFYGKLTEMWHNYAEIDINDDYDTSKRYSIDDLVKIWEQQRKEATE